MEVNFLTADERTDAKLKLEYEKDPDLFFSNRRDDLIHEGELIIRTGFEKIRL
jgi:hypothetical protein